MWLPTLIVLAGAVALGVTQSVDGFDPGETCDRKCDGTPKTCYFKFNVEDYSILTAACGNCSSGVTEDCFREQCIPADGFVKTVIVVNRTLPGPPIVACAGDTLVVDVVNQMAEQAITIHWHGIRQKETPYMDGVPYVTQCPILPGTTFRYRFPVPDAGTFFWHSHIGSSKLDGVEGMLIVRAKDDPLSSLYDDDLTEHVIFIQDWIHELSHYWTPGPHIPGSLQEPDSVLINGLGRLQRNGSTPFIPLATFTVESGKRYRFRAIGATCMTCYFALKIQSHNLTVITADGGLRVQPTTFDSIAINSADRFDFILHADQKPGIYYISVESIDPICRPVRQIAVLIYKGSTADEIEPSPPAALPLGKVLNDPMSWCNGSTPDLFCMSQMTGVSDAPSVAGNNGGYMQLDIVWDIFVYTPEQTFNPAAPRPYEEPRYGTLARFGINGNIFEFPSSPLGTQFSEIPASELCPDDCYERASNGSCACTSYYSVPRNAILDLIVYNRIQMNLGFSHPFHLHGYNCHVLEQGVFPNTTGGMETMLKELRERLRNDRISLEKRPQKDSLSTPANGYSVLRCKADNCGWWFAHCHFVFHGENGMATSMKVCSDQEMKPVPENFPTCGNYYGS